MTGGPTGFSSRSQGDRPCALSAKKWGTKAGSVQRYTSAKPESGAMSPAPSVILMILLAEKKSGGGTGGVRR